ncbi:MAG: hypothetical protein U9N53_01475 [Bacteroidota bacterium]|nr:hypothetical protein [Bacteroidota bacterium]
MIKTSSKLGIHFQVGFLFILSLSIILLFSCNQKAQEKQAGSKSDLEAKSHHGFQHDQLNLIWETPYDFIIPESVLINGDYIYVSNINGEPTQKNSAGYISKLSLDGEVIKKEWVSGINAPKGMGVFNNELYVTDIDQLVVIDMDNAKILERYDAENAVFLNDIDIDSKGRVFISDMQQNEIFIFENGELKSWLQGDHLISVNGLFVDGDFLMAGVENKVLKINIDNKNITTYLENTGPIDGLEAYGDGRFIFSDWTGHIHIASPGKEKTLLIDTSKEGINAADIWFVQETKILYVPTFIDNRVVAYKVNL